MRRRGGLGSILFFCAAVVVIMLAGAPGLRARDLRHDEASVRAVPYRFVGENEHWHAEYVISLPEENLRQAFAQALEQAEREHGQDSLEYQNALRAQPGYQGTLWLTYRGSSEDLQAAEEYTVIFGKGTDHKTSARRQSTDRRGFLECLTGELPALQAAYPQDANVAGAIPPVDGSYPLEIQVRGASGLSGSLTMEKKEDGA